MIGIDAYPHRMELTVRFKEVDMLGVVNNAEYLSYLEHARIQYMLAAGLLPEGDYFDGIDPHFVVRNTIDYRGRAGFNDTLTIYSRIAFVKSSSYGFEHLIKRGDDLIAEGTGVLVQIDTASQKGKPLDDSFRRKVKAYDPAVKFLENEEEDKL